MVINLGIDENGKPYVSIERGCGHDRILRKKGKSIIDFPGNFTVIDIETTGLDPVCSEIIELSAIKYVDYKQVSTFSQLVKPSELIDDFITRLTGITNDMVACAPSIDKVLPDFLSFVGNDTVIGHNVNFDVNFIYDNCELFNLPRFSNDYIDTMRMSRKLMPDLKNHKLATVSRALNVTLENAHRALSDCLATASCYLVMRAIALEKYGTIEEFVRLSDSKPLKAKDISTTVTDFDSDNPLYGKVCCFTGALDHMPRKDAMQLVANVGGICADNVTKKTNYLILGNTDYCSSVKGGKTNKMLKAEKAKLSGQDIEIISENIFFEMVGIRELQKDS